MQVTDRIAFALFCVGFVTGISWSAAMWSSNDVALEFAMVLGVILVALGVIAKVGPWLMERQERRRAGWADEGGEKHLQRSRYLH